MEGDVGVPNFRVDSGSTVLRKYFPFLRYTQRLIWFSIATVKWLAIFVHVDRNLSNTFRNLIVSAGKNDI